MRNRFKESDLIHRVPEQPWTKVHDIVQEAVIKTIPKKKKCKKAKRLSEEALQIAEKRRGAKGKGEKERYKHLNAEFQRIARRDKKAFHSGQCKEIEKNNGKGKTRDLFKKIRDTKETLYAKMGTIKDRKCMDLTEHDRATSLSLFTFMQWRRKWQPTPVFLPGESQGRQSLVGCYLWGHTESDTTEVT